MSDHQPYKILFLCTGNSARSIFGEYLIRRFGLTKFESYSAGSSPKGQVNPYTLRVLKDLYQIDASDARSKSWEEFQQNGTIFDFVITVCDDARESCPVWPGQPIIAHWGCEDPAAFEGSDQETFDFFYKVARLIQWRIELLTALPFDKLDKLRLAEATQKIAGDTAGKEAPQTTPA